MRYDDIIDVVADRLGLPHRVVDKTYKSFWLFIRDTISSLPLKEEIDEDSFNTLRTNFNIPSLGKLTCTYDRLKGMKRRMDYIRNIRDRNDKGKES